MFLAELFIENFRVFGAKSVKEHLELELRPGLNVLVGENDSGKSAIIDAIRLVLSTRAHELQRLSEEDFHTRSNARASTLTIRCTFRGLSPTETARFLEWLSIEGDMPVLIVNLVATRHEAAHPRARRVTVTTRTGRNADGPQLDGEVRDFLQATYLQPLRDAEAELASGRGSRLAQILEAHPAFKLQAVEGPETLVGILRGAEKRIQNSDLVKGAARNLNDEYLKPLSLGDGPLTGDITFARGAELRQILEKLELWLSPDSVGAERTRHGLGLNNVLFMAAELLLLGGGAEFGSPLLLVEEPEAHLHPQLQLRLIEFLDERSKEVPPAAMPGTAPSEGGQSTTSLPPAKRTPVQIIVTTHSPNLASKVPLSSIVLMSKAKCYPLAPAQTQLGPADYAFLGRFLDVTRANLFFAKGVLLVEGDGEALLLPTLASKLGRPLSKHGVSIVKVGSRGLFRYSRILQRSDGVVVPIRVACIADFDWIPPEADYAHDAGEDDDQTPLDEDKTVADAAPKQPETPASRRFKLCCGDGGAVKTFVSPAWTLEHDLALCGLAESVHVAIQLAIRAKKMTDVFSAAQRAKLEAEARQNFAQFKLAQGGDAAKLAALVYKPLYRKRASKAQTAEFLAELIENDARSVAEFRQLIPAYLVQAIDYVTEAPPLKCTEQRVRGP